MLVNKIFCDQLQVMFMILLDMGRIIYSKKLVIVVNLTLEFLQ